MIIKKFVHDKPMYFHEELKRLRFRVTFEFILNTLHIKFNIKRKKMADGEVGQN